mgnify:CR=1 FL=1
MAVFAMCLIVRAIMAWLSYIREQMMHYLLVPCTV